MQNTMQTWENPAYTIELMEWHANKRVFMYWIPSLVFWEPTNCARTEIELRSLSVLLERRPQPTTHLPTPRWFYFLICFMPAVTKVQTPSENVTFWTLERVLSQFSCEIWSIWDWGVYYTLLISIMPVTSAAPNKSQSCARRDISNFGDKRTGSCYAQPVWL